MQKTTFKLLLLLLILTTSISNAQLSEGFEGGTIPAGWTQEFVSNTLSWTAATQNGNASVTPRTGTYLGRFLTGAYGDVTKLVTPSMNLTAVTNPQLKFYFTNVNWFGDIDELRVYYKTSAAGPWVQIGADYTNENATWTEVTLLLPNPSADYYVAFEGTSNWARGVTLDDITVGPAPTCLSPNTITASNVTTSSVNLAWTHSIGTQTNFQYVIQAAGTGIPAGAGTPVTGLSVVNNTLSPATNYEAWVRADCGAGDFSSWRGPVTFRTNSLVTCGTPVNTSYCYVDNDTTTWIFTSNTGGPLRVTFNAGEVEDGWDELIILDSNGTTELYNGYGNSGDLTGLIFDSTGDTIIVKITSDSSVNCQDDAFTSWNFTVVCATCVNPTATFTTVPDCADGEYSVNVNVTSLGSATSLSISDGTTTLTNITATGIQTFGPYASGSSITIVLTNQQDGSCTLSSGSLSYTCPPANDECANAIVVNCGSVVTGSTATGATDSGNNASADVWYSYNGPAGDITVSLCTNTTFDTLIRVFDACGGTEIISNDDSCGLQSSATFTANGTSTYYIMVEGFSTNTGNFELTASCVLSNNNFDNYAFKAYPNPVKDILNLSYTSEMSKVQVINMLGQVVIDRNMNTTEGQINMSELNSGAYIVNITVGDTVKTIKVIKQ